MNLTTKVFVLLTVLVLVGCNSDTRALEVIDGAPVRIGTCHLNVEQARADDEAKFVGVRYACGVGADALASEAWWGAKAPPLAFTMSPGDCLLLEGTYYCLEDVAHQRSGTFRPAFRQAGSDVLEAIVDQP